MRRFLVFAAMLTACAPSGNSDADTAETGADTATGSDTPTATTGTLAVRFRIDDDWGDAVLADGESLLGNYWGDFYLSDDVTGIGPNEGASALASVQATDVDLTDYVNGTEVLLTLADLPAGYVTALGFFDSDGNADPSSPNPDSGDPVTLPNENEFEVIGGETTEATIYFGFRNP
ncbi:MAG: hypothetical protein RLZZ383_1261 [Pseudomonadota bacterium]|jgi:hypothetical protein